MGSKLKPRKRTIVVKICKFCGKQFETIPSREKAHNFCNRECKNNYHITSLKCNNCNKIFSIRRYKQKRRFCSSNCQKDFTKKKNQRSCLNCDNNFSPNPADIKRGKAKFCSRKCVLEYKNKD